MRQTTFVTLTLVALLAEQPSWAVTYECLDASGKTVFTDSPSQLTRCVSATKGGSASTIPPASTPTPAPPQMEPSPPPVLPPGPTTSDQITVPVMRVGRSLVVQAKLNGSRDARLILDTGAEITVLSHAAALDAGLLPSQTVATVTLNTAGGSVRADVFRVGSVSVGTAEVGNVAVVVHDLPDAPAGVDGLLGLTFLDRFLVTLDAQKGELHLKPRQ